MEKTGLRRPDFAVFQNQQTGSDRPPLETQLRFYFRSYYGGLGYENLFACPDGYEQRAFFFSRLWCRAYSLVASRIYLPRHSGQRDRDHDLCEQKNFG